VEQAFLDRVDLMLFMGPPSTLARSVLTQNCLIHIATQRYYFLFSIVTNCAMSVFVCLFCRYQILHSCLSELMDKGVVRPACLLLSDPRDLLLGEGGGLGGEGVGASAGTAGAGMEEAEADGGCMGIQGEPYERRLWSIASQCDVSTSISS
jgi:hypothetical protein